MHISGKCHCGAISFTATVDPNRVLVCHCADCQALSGAPFRAVLPTAAVSVDITGTAKHHVKVAESGNKRVNAFCPECGTQLYATESEGPPKVLNLRVAQRDQLAPAAQIWGVPYQCITRVWRIPSCNLNRRPGVRSNPSLKRSINGRPSVLPLAPA